MENVRKRAQRDVENASRYGLEKFAVELLPVLDSLQLAVSNVARADLKSLAEGQAATLEAVGEGLRTAQYPRDQSGRRAVRSRRGMRR